MPRERRRTQTTCDGSPRWGGVSRHGPSTGFVGVNMVSATWESAAFVSI